MMVRDSWLGTTANLGSIGALYNLTMDPYEKYDMVFNGAAPSRVLTSSPGRYTGEDNGWALSLIYPAIIDFDKSIIKYPNITRYVGGASTDLVPDLQHPDNPVPLLEDQIDRLHIGGKQLSSRSRIRRCRGREWRRGHHAVPIKIRPSTWYSPTSPSWDH
jgi:hypothetical protein